MKFMRTRHFLNLFFVVIILVVASSFVAAEEGCFLYEDSPLYCNAISFEEANEECSYFEECDVDSIFVEDDCNAFPQCEQILCQSTCDYQFAGTCSGGAVPEGEEDMWCSEGCCFFQEDSGNNCEISKNKWTCNINAKNKDAPMFLFDKKVVNEQACSLLCGENSQMLANLAFEEVFDDPSLPLIASSNSQDEIFDEEETEKGKDEKTNEKSESKTLDEESGFGFLGWFAFVFAIIFAVFLYFHYKRSFDFSHLFNKKGNNDLAEDNSLGTSANMEKSPFWLSPFLSNPLAKIRLKKIKEKRRHKVKKEQRENFLKEHHLEIKDMTSGEFKKLKKLVRDFSFSKKDAFVREEKKIFNNLDELIHKRKEVQSVPAENSLSSKKQSLDIIEELRKIVKKK
jgi:hypothetical protein